jgi:hypothetical protein
MKGAGDGKLSAVAEPEIQDMPSEVGLSTAGQSGAATQAPDVVGKADPTQVIEHLLRSPQQVGGRRSARLDTVQHSSMDVESPIVTPAPKKMKKPLRRQQSMDAEAARAISLHEHESPVVPMRDTKPARLANLAENPSAKQDGRATGAGAALTKHQELLPMQQPQPLTVTNPAAAMSPEQYLVNAINAGLPQNRRVCSGAPQAGGSISF